MQEFSLSNTIKDTIYEYQFETPKAKRIKETPITIPEKVTLSHILEQNEKTGNDISECRQKLRAIYSVETLYYTEKHISKIEIDIKKITENTRITIIDLLQNTIVLIIENKIA